MDYTIVHVPGTTVHHSCYWQHLLDLSHLNHTTIKEAGIYEKEYFTTQIINYLLYPQISAIILSYCLKPIGGYFYYFIYGNLFY